MMTLCSCKTYGRIRNISAIALISLCCYCCTPDNKPPAEYAAYVDSSVSVYGPYAAIKLPIDKGVPLSNPIQIALGPDSLMYAANQTGEIYSLRDTDGDGLEDMALLYCNVKDAGLRSPAGFTSRGDTVYIGTAQGIYIYLDKNKDGKADTSWVFFNDIPTSEHPYEWTSGLSFGPDGWLYFALTTDSWNAGASPDHQGYRGAILRVSPDGKKAERLATGIRSVYSTGFNQAGELFFTDNEGGGNPTEELNRLVINSYYGHNPLKYGADSITGPVHSLQTEAAPSGMEFNASHNHFGGTSGDLFVAFYGPGEFWTRGGVGRLAIRQGADGSYTYEEFPVADIPKLSDLAFGRDGSLYLSHHGKADYWYNAIYENEGSFYKLVYDSTLATRPVKPRTVSARILAESSVEAGRQLFAERACLGCHAVDGSTELLGPDLQDVAKRFSRDEILEEILEPSKRIKPSMMAQRIHKKDGQVLLGRVVNANEKQVSLMLIGNQVVQVDRNEILSIENEKKSLMYEGLLKGLSDTETAALIDYLVSLSQ